mmetsp:Transcript_1773/g.5580  ORF Transcript_1773/g.5580 Transcript_1773/m.5580 type:complete len:109 (-) Transcript_1773:137-463(-)
MLGLACACLHPAAVGMARRPSRHMPEPASNPGGQGRFVRLTHRRALRRILRAVPADLAYTIGEGATSSQRARRGGTLQHEVGVDVGWLYTSDAFIRRTGNCGCDIAAR